MEVTERYSKESQALTDSAGHPVHFVGAVAVVAEVGGDAAPVRPGDGDGELREVSGGRVQHELGLAAVGHQAQPLARSPHLTGVHKVHVERTACETKQKKTQR